MGKKAWRKSDVRDVAEAVGREKAAERVSREPVVLRVDTAGSASRNVERRVRKLENRKSPALLAKETAAALERRKTLDREKAAKADRRKLKDLWTTTSVKEENATSASNPEATEKVKTEAPRTVPRAKRAKAAPRAKRVKLFDCPSVCVASSGQSVNPAEAPWKATLLTLAESLGKTVESRKECLERESKPVTRALTNVFNSDVVEKLTVWQRSQLFLLLSASRGLEEDPETFLARTLPLITDAPQAPEEEAGDEEGEEGEREGEQGGGKKKKGLKGKSGKGEGGETGGEDGDLWKEMFFEGKTTKDKNRALRHEAHLARVLAHKLRKERNRETHNLSSIVEQVKGEERERQMAVERGEREKAEKKAAIARGEHTNFKVGKTKFVEPLAPVATAAALARQRGSLRKLETSPFSSSLEDRFASFQRRGMIELGASLTSAAYHMQSGRAKRLINRNEKQQRKQSVAVCKLRRRAAAAGGKDVGDDSD